MLIHWQTVFFLLIISIPGIAITIPRSIAFLLRNHPEQGQERLNRVVIAQMLFIVLMMSIAGNVLSTYTLFKAPVFSSLFHFQPPKAQLWLDLMPVILYTLLGTVGFLILYQAIFKYFFEPETMRVLTKLRHSLKLSGCLLYAIPEEIILRYGLFNLLGIFAFLLLGKLNFFIQSNIIFISAVIYSATQIPLYTAAGCPSGRKFIVVVTFLYIWQGALFGTIFIKYGLLAAILSHILFYAIWWVYDQFCRTSKL